jgi:hypothetical protein
LHPARVPPDASILVEMGTSRPELVGFKALVPFRMLWVITNGVAQSNFLWLTLRKTGFYVAFGGPGHSHTSYHSDGRCHWRSDDHNQELDPLPPLPYLRKPVPVQNATAVVTDEAIAAFRLKRFRDDPVDRVVYLDNRKLPEAIHYHVWLVPPFQHGQVPLHTDRPAHIHIVTHTIPWIQVIIYEQRKRPHQQRGD